MNLIIVLYATVLAFASLYAPQPILPLLGEAFGVGPGQASLLITTTLLPLSIAPVAYGFILEAVPAKTLLRAAVLLLALAQLPFLISDVFWVLVGVRFFQGLLLPAVFTSLMTYLSTVTAPERVRRAMSFYIAATITGGFAGRALSGFIAEFGHWRMTFLVLAVGLLAAFGLLFRLETEVRARFARPSLHAIGAVLGDRFFLKSYLVIFLVFFVFASILNFLPFRLRELSDSVSEFRIAMVYSGYLIGIVVALASITIIRRLGNEVRAILSGLAVYALATLAFAAPSVPLVFAVMWLFCAGMFLVHSVLSGFLNHRATERKGLVNGLYISFYYAGGALGSFLPGHLYRHFGWEVYIAGLSLLVTLAIGIGVGLRKGV